MKRTATVIDQSEMKHDASAHERLFQRGPSPHRHAALFGVAVLFLCAVVLAFPAVPLAAQAPDGGSADRRASNSNGQENPLTVDEAVQRAIAESGDVERARIALDQARADIDIARAGRLPDISGSVSGSYLFSPPEAEGIRRGELGQAPPAGSGELPTPIPDTDIDIIPAAASTFYSISAQLEQALFTWGKITEGIEAAGYEEQATQAELTGERRDIASRTREAYFSAALARDTLEALRDAEETMQRIVDDREEAFDAGTRTREEVLQMRSQAAAVRRRRVSAEQGLDSALRALGILIGADAGEHQLISSYRESADPRAEEELLDAAVGFSPDLEALRNRSRAAESALFIEERSNRLRYPDIGLVLDVEWSGQGAPFRDNWADRWDTDVTLTIASQFSIFDGGAQAARIRKAEGDLETARLGLSDARDGVEIAVRRAFESVRSAEAEYEESAAALEYAAEQRRNAEVSFENDLITREEMLLARLQETFSEIERDAAAFSLEQASGELEALTGDILDGRGAP